MIRPLPGIAAVTLALLSPAAKAEIDYNYLLDEQGMHNVLIHVEQKNCKAAVSELNKGIANKQRAVLLLAGSMYEQGICLKQDWDQAAHYYQLADQAGHRAAMSRLISGYAEKNRDPAAALWWMAKSRYQVTKACSSANAHVDDPDAFVAALNSWPSGQLAACVYIAGVYTRIMGDVESPGDTKGVNGDAIMTFVPSTGSITWKRGATDRVNVTRMLEGADSEASIFNEKILKHVRAVSARALAQFARPDGIDPELVISDTLHYRTFLME